MTKFQNVINDSFVFFEFIFTIELFFTFFFKMVLGNHFPSFFDRITH